MATPNKELNKTLTIDNEVYNINAVTADKVNNTLTIQGNSSPAATFDGSDTKSVNIKSGEATTVTVNSNNITIGHANTSDQDSVTVAEGSFITGVTLDNYGHVTGITTTHIIAKGTADPGASTAGTYYFKY